MIQGNSLRRAKSFILIFSVIYSIFESNILYLTPIITILVPYHFMKNKEITTKALIENQKTFSNLLIFNFICIELVGLLTQKGNFTTFSISIIILICFIYFKILYFKEKKFLSFETNPKAIYEEMKIRINTLENIYKKGLTELENTEDEKMKKCLQNKLDKLQVKINISKQQLSIIETIINSTENNND